MSTEWAGTDGPAPLGLDPNPGLRITALYWLYDVLWTVAIVLSSPWWLARCLYDDATRSMVRGRLTLDLHRLPANGERTRVLVHGVSVGEIKASKSIVAGLSKTCDVVVSASTNTGMVVARQLYPDLEVVRFPLDHLWLASRFMRCVGPQRVVLMELEIWPNFLRLANRLGIPVAIVSGRITESSYTNYRRLGATLPQFNRITFFAAQDEAHARRFAELARSEERVLVTGNVKIDGLRVGPVPHDAAYLELARLAGPADGQLLIVAGSTHDPEEQMVQRALQASVPDARIVIVPRHPERASAVVEDLRRAGASAQLLTGLRAGLELPDPDRPLVVDTIGELERVYGLADLVFVGGSLVPHGGQNMLECAAQGCPVIYGPHVDNFTQEAGMLEAAGAGVRVADEAELASCLARLAGDRDLRARMGRAGMKAVDEQKGATKRTLTHLAQRCCITVAG